jgi:hypothetical protein
MKRLFYFFILSSFFLACNNSGTMSNTSGDSTSTNPTNIENVNGNIPDSTSGMTLNQSLPIDSSRLKDSARKDSTRH